MAGKRSFRCQAVVRNQGDAGAIDIPSVANGDATYWASTTDAIRSPVITNADLDMETLATGNSDYLIIAHTKFIARLINPNTENGEKDLVQNKESHRHSVKVVDYEQVAQLYGYGHRIPESITTYLVAEAQNIQICNTCC